MQFSMFLNCARVTLLAIQSVESIPHELPFFQKRYDYFGRLTLRLTLQTYRELLELVSRDQ